MVYLLEEQAEGVTKESQDWNVRLGSTVSLPETGGSNTKADLLWLLLLSRSLLCKLPLCLCLSVC